MPTYRTLDHADLAGKRVLVRVDHNVELTAEGALKNDEKIRATLPTIQYLLEKRARVILMTHVGRPKGKVDPQCSTKTVAMHLQRLLPGVALTHVTSTVGPAVTAAAQQLQEGAILYLENVRFLPEEEGTPEQQASLGKQLAALADVYVNEAFASCHTYEEASTCAVSRLLPAYAGMHLLREITMLGTVVDAPRHPLTLIISGAKMKTKIPVVEYFSSKGDDILLGGCIANTFVAARGFPVGTSKYEKDFLAQAQAMMQKAGTDGRAKIHVPSDVVVAPEPKDGVLTLDLPVEKITADVGIFDVGKQTTADFLSIIEKSATIVWNGPLGLYEIDRFAGATKRIAAAVAAATKRGATSIIGGGDTLDFHVRYGCPLDVYTFVSTGGGAMLEFLSGKPFPAFAALRV